MKKIESLCPSAPAVPGARLFGILNADGEIEYLRDSLEIPENSKPPDSSADPLENRFRFAAPCAEGRCAQWKNGRCGVPDMIANIAPPRETLPRCAIRKQCRWFSQDGTSACKTCSLVAMKGGVQ